MSDTDKDSKMFYQIGHRDERANLFMMIRLDGVEKTLLELAKTISDNPHADWYLKQHKEQK